MSDSKARRSDISKKPAISFNLHTLTNGPLNVPISINYDASGIRPDQHPGWTGMNFNLSAGGAISRTFRGHADNFTNGLGNGYIFAPSRLNIISAGTWSTTTGMQNAALSTFDDTEPDEFTFSAPGFSGKFYWGSDGRFKVLSDQPVVAKFIPGNGIVPLLQSRQCRKTCGTIHTAGNTRSIPLALLLLRKMELLE